MHDRDPVRVSGPVLSTDAVATLAGAAKVCLCFLAFQCSNKVETCFFLTCQNLALPSLHPILGC